MSIATTLSARYFIRVPNFGDRITPLLIELIAEKVPFYERPDNPHILGCGSILQSASTNSIVWGSGFITQHSHFPDLTEGNVRAVRGRLSLERLKSELAWVGDIPVGDPGSLLPLVYPRKRDTKYRFGVLPHYVDKKHPFIDYCRAHGALIIDPQRDVTDVLDDIFLCEKILSSSLHGLIVSDAYGIPNRWIELSHAIIGDGFKFHDYYSSRITSQSYPERFQKNSSYGDILATCSLTQEKFSLDDLYCAFPNDKSCTKLVAGLTNTSSFRRQ